MVAFVYPPSLDSRPVKILLKDTGSGYPDITQGDGIYSAYLTVQALGTFRYVFISILSIQGYHFKTGQKLLHIKESCRQISGNTLIHQNVEVFCSPKW